MRLIQWVLSKLFPYKSGCYKVSALKADSVWDKQKHRESEDFYGGQDGTDKN